MYLSKMYHYEKITALLNECESLRIDLKRSGPFTLRGTFKSTEIPWVIRITPQGLFHQNLLLFSGSDGHLASIRNNGKSLAEYTLNTIHNDEKSYYSAFNIPWIIPEIREEIYDQDQLVALSGSELIQDSDLRGAFHNHSTYSDGKNTIREMAEKCISLGYEYLGISDHSQSAYYANGLQEFHVLKQLEEIDLLNEELAPFTIFKGIESDILNDGSLDYRQEILAKFDFIVASIHSNLTMDAEKATARLIKAIENPYTTMLGHATGRLLLKRPGYPIDHSKIIDACAQHGVMIEINANPKRLDMDWRWVSYALQKGVMLTINPDAHEIDGLNEMRYGVIVGRKGGLTKTMTFNAKPLAEVNQYLAERKAQIK
ncbi:MAG: PHP domain-containing protein [Cyclobacteriaceae bacterium]|nr:PHP domain-containing protein [Cyclobacteriaceae bacterium]